MTRLILTSSFNAVALELSQKGVLPKAPRRVAFIATAGDLYAERPWIEADQKALADLGYTMFDVDLKNKNPGHLKSELELSDIIFVAGGNTTYLFEWAHASGFASMVYGLLASGRIYIGSSAGSIFAGPSVEPFVEEDQAELPKDFILHDSNGLHLVDYVVLPHYPRYAEKNDHLAQKFVGRWTFMKMTDQEYRVEP